MAWEVHPDDVAYVERDPDLGGYFAYMEDDVYDADVEPMGQNISLRTYTALHVKYKIPTAEEYYQGRRKLRIEKTDSQPKPVEIPPVVETTSLLNDLNTKICPTCGNEIIRSDFPNLSDVNWSQKLYCSPLCRRRRNK